MPQEGPIHLSFLALAVAGVCLSTLGLSYTWGLVKNDIEIWPLPSVSLAIDNPPVSCLGTVGLTSTAFLAALLAVFRYCGHNVAIDDNKAGHLLFPRSWSKDALKRTAAVCMIVGVSAALFLDYAACVQQHVSKELHLTLSCAFYAIQSVYMCFASILEFSIRAGRRWTVVIRLVMGVTALMALLVYVATLFVSDELSLSINGASSLAVFGAMILFHIVSMWDFFGLSYGFFANTEISAAMQLGSMVDLLATAEDFSFNEASSP